MAAKVDKDKCDGCGSCVEACAVDAIALKDGKAVVNDDECIECAVCVDECPNNAIEI